MCLPVTQEGPCDIILKVSTESGEMRIHPNPQATERWKGIILKSHAHASLGKKAL